MSGIFISYRREDSAGFARALSGDLTEHFGPDHVFMDVDTLAPTPGVDFVDAIQKALGSCDVLIALIGPRWLTANDAAGRRRLDDPEDLVRLEVGSALHRDIPVIPVLVQGASMPRREDLPEGLVTLARRQAHDISDARWKYDVERLIQTLEAEAGEPVPEVRPAARPLQETWLSILLLAFVWAIGWAIGWATADALRSAPVLGAYLGVIGGLCTLIVLWWVEPSVHWKHVLLGIVGWAIGGMLGGTVGRPLDLTLLAAIGGLSTMLVLRWARPSMPWKHVLVGTLGWTIGGIIGDLVILSRGGPQIILDCVSGALQGAIGGTAMLRHLARE